MTTNLAKFIDHTLLKPTATAAQIQQLCLEASEYNFAAVCVNPQFVPLAAKLLADNTVKVCTVIGFPLGASTLESKLFEAQQAMNHGANELDYVLNLRNVFEQQYDLVAQEMQAFVALKARQPATIIKVILETCYLTDEQIIEICQLAAQSGLDFVKTSTGFGSGGATFEHVRLMRQTVGSQLGVKASGGIRTYTDAVAMLEAGASRIGASAGVKILSPA